MGDLMSNVAIAMNGGVLIEKKREHHILKREDKGKWKEESSFLLSKWKEIPWYVVFLEPVGASVLHLQYAGDVLERSIQSRLEEIFELDNGLKARGVVDASPLVDDCVESCISLFNWLP